VSKIRQSSKTPKDSALKARNISSRKASAVALQKAKSDDLSMLESIKDNWVMDAVNAISISINMDIVAGF
jgi:hypothetical protein